MAEDAALSSRFAPVIVEGEVKMPVVAPRLLSAGTYRETAVRYFASFSCGTLSPNRSSALRKRCGIPISQVYQLP